MKDTNLYNMDSILQGVLCLNPTDQNTYDDTHSLFSKI